MPYMSRQAGSHLVVLIIIGMFVQLAVVGYVFYQSYEGRVDLVRAQRAGCERSKLDSLTNAEGWRKAQAARAAEGDFLVAEQYSSIASSLEERGHIDCAQAYPKVRIVP
jgi:hypothetical protein